MTFLLGMLSAVAIYYIAKSFSPVIIHTPQKQTKVVSIKEYDAQDKEIKDSVYKRTSNQFREVYASGVRTSKAGSGLMYTTIFV